MWKKVFKKAACCCLTGICVFGLAACGAPEEEPAQETQGGVEYDEEGNPIEKEEAREDPAILLADSEAMVSGLFAVMEDGNITSNGVWLSESEVGEIAGQYSGTAYQYEEGSFKKDEVKYVASFYNINGEALGAMYFNDNMDMCYNNQYMVTDPVMRGMFTDIKNTIRADSILESRVPEKGDNTGEAQQQTPAPEEGGGTDQANATVEISTQAFADAGLEVDTAEVLAQSMFNLGIPVVKKAEVTEDAILFTDTSDNNYSIMIKDGKIYSVFNETGNVYVYHSESDTAGEPYAGQAE